MRKPRNPQLLGSLELQVMKVAWELGDVSVADVVERLSTERALHHNTVMTVMTRLTDKKFLRRYARDGRSYGYQPRVSFEEISTIYLDLVREQLFGGSVSRTVAAFLGGQRLSGKQARSMKRLLDELGEDGVSP